MNQDKFYVIQQAPNVPFANPSILGIFDSKDRAELALEEYLNTNCFTKNMLPHEVFRIRQRYQINPIELNVAAPLAFTYYRTRKF